MAEVELPAGGWAYDYTSVEAPRRGTVREGETTWSAIGTPQNYLPLRHRQRNDAGVDATLRIVKQPTEWTFEDGRLGSGHLEYHDLIEDGVPVGLHD